jgi:hypothetical protein
MWRVGRKEQRCLRPLNGGAPIDGATSGPDPVANTMRHRRIAFDHSAMMVSDSHMMIGCLTRHNDNKSHAECDAERRCLTHVICSRVENFPALYYEKAVTAIKHNIFCE